MTEELPKAYEPAGVEADIYSLWEQSGAFAPAAKTEKNQSAAAEQAPFTIIAPPPNANGALHIGHAVGVTLQDLMIRYHRMKGQPTLWLPGYDHAGFETQVVYEKKLEKEGRSRFQIPREELYQEMYQFCLANKETMISQLKKLGASLDWSRQTFTLDPKIVAVVYKTFKQLHDDGLVYRAERPVNWCTKHQTSLSDLEVTHEERIDPLYYIKYGPLTLATVRPETKFGDTAIAVHPDDPRYQQYIGQEIAYESVLGPAKLTVIADSYVNPEFGTGVVKITPAHDPNDFEVAKRHNLPIKVVIDQYGKMTEAAGPYAGLKIKEARAKIVEALQAKDLIEKIDENYNHSVGLCYKCKNVIEPRVLPQWWIATTKTSKGGKNLRDDAVAAVKNGETKFVTKKFENTFYSWMDNLLDWNISRQIVWGIQLPIWYCQCENCQQASKGQTSNNDISTVCPPIITDGSTPEACPNCGSQELIRDNDVFDTWFSSGQWPYATLQAQGEADYQQFYPTSVMETGYDILFFWVSRMLMLGLYATDQVPFKEIYLHGLVRDKDRQKMSKSKGNVIDPLGVAEQYGSDAVRMALIFGTSAGNDIVISEDKIRGMRNFANKVWNISRFIQMNLEPNKEYTLGDLEAARPATRADQQLFDNLNALSGSLTKQIESHQFHLAAEQLYDFIWHDFADRYLESSKEQLKNNELDSDLTESTRHFLLACLLRQLCLLHPFMPFITEAIYQGLPIANKPNLLMTAQWPGSATD